MSAEDEPTGSPPEDVPGATPEEPAKKAKASKKPLAKAKAKAKAAAAKAPAAKKPAAKKAAEAKKATAAKEPEGKEPAAKEPAAKEPKAAKGANAPAKEPAKSESKPAVRSRKDSRKPGSRRRVVSAHARYVRTSARKARMVCGHLRGKSVQEARAILAFTPRDVARDWSKLLESAVANAESNHELLEDDLIVREAYADEGPTLKRFRPRAMGRAAPIRKRTSHLTITLTPGPEPRTTKR
jgi:ribosomal protein L22